MSIEIIRKRYTIEAWKAIEMVYGEMRRNPITYVKHALLTQIQKKQV